MRNKKLSQAANAGFFLIAASILRAVSVYCFTVPNNFAPGGVTGISSMLHNLFGWNVSLLMILLNLPLIFVAFKALNLEFAIKTTITIFLISFFIQILTSLGFATYSGKDADLILAAVFGGALSGVALAMVLKVNASTGGTDILGAAIQKKFRATNVAWFIFALDFVVVFSSAIVFQNLGWALYSFVDLFVGSKTTETIQNGLSSAITYNIITKKPDEISQKIIENLSRGVTKIHAVGQYSNSETSILICVVRKRQMTNFHKIVKETDPDAFAFAMSAREVLGKGFTER